MVLGDFNCIRTFSEKRGGVPTPTRYIMEFNAAIERAGLVEPRWEGAAFTWTNKVIGPRRVTCKLDRVLINHEVLSRFQDVLATTGNCGFSDHAPIVLQLNHNGSQSPKPFRFFNMWTSHNSFLKTVEEAWKIRVIGNPMYQVTQKLKAVKAALKAWNLQVFGKCKNPKSKELDRIKAQLAYDQDNAQLAIDEAAKIDELNAALDVEESFYRQK